MKFVEFDVHRIYEWFSDEVNIFSMKTRDARGFQCCHVIRAQTLSFLFR